MCDTAPNSAVWWEGTGAVVTDGFVVLRALETRKKHSPEELSCCSAQCNPL